MGLGGTHCLPFGLSSSPKLGGGGGGVVGLNGDRALGSKGLPISRLDAGLPNDGRGGAVRGTV